MKKFHAHLYFEPSEREFALTVYEKAKSLEGSDFTVWKLFEEKVGPHALPMFELHFNGDQEEATLQWLNQNRHSLSVLIHEDTGDDLRDHLERVRWLGKPLPIAFDFFKRVARDSSLAIHATIAKPVDGGKNARES